MAVYAPTEVASVNEKDRFNDELQNVLDTISPTSLLILEGDFNAQCKVDHAAWNGVVGPYALGKLNDNGSRLLSMAAHNDLVLTNTRFWHAKRHLHTWISNDGVTRHQIDYILVRKLAFQYVNDARVYRSADVSTDHQLLIAKMSIRFSKRFAARRPPRVDVSELKGRETAQRYQTLAEEKIRDIDPKSPTANSQLADALRKAAETVLPTIQFRRTRWATDATLDLISRKRQARQAGDKPAYNRLNRDVKEALPNLQFVRTRRQRFDKELRFPFAPAERREIEIDPLSPDAPLVCNWCLQWNTGAARRKPKGEIK